MIAQVDTVISRREKLLQSNRPMEAIQPMSCLEGERTYGIGQVTTRV